MAPRRRNRNTYTSADDLYGILERSIQKWAVVGAAGQRRYMFMVLPLTRQAIIYNQIPHYNPMASCWEAAVIETRSKNLMSLVTHCA